MVCQELLSSDTAPSHSSAESNFRELDDAFLQTQTRIWLGEVLQIRLDEQIVIPELLADGELLFLVSKVVWKLLLAKHMELRHTKALKNQPFASMRNSGRYRPYSNVDSFLKICKILGLTGIDLFSPSDVVERRNTRRVCMCIRSFSKKLRSEGIDVPDFDVVTCVVAAMPKDLVGCIRRSIELSRSSPTDSSSYYLQKHSDPQLRRAYSVTESIRDWETYPDQSSDTEIKHQVHQFDDSLSDDDLYGYASEINHNVPSSMVESVEHDCEFNWSSSPYCGASHADFSGMTSHFDTRVHDSRSMDYDYFENELLRDDASVIGTPLNENMQVIVHKSASSHGSNSTPENTEIGRCSEMGENKDPVQVSGMSCLSSDAEALNLEDQFDAENDFQYTESMKLHHAENDWFNRMKEDCECESQDIIKNKEMTYGITSIARYSYSVKELAETEHSLYSPDCFFCKTDSSNISVSLSNDISSTLPKTFLDKDRKSQVGSRCFHNTTCDQSSEELPSCQCYALPAACKWDQKGKCAMTSSGATDNKGSLGLIEDCSHEETTPFKQKTSDVTMTKVFSSCVLNKEDAVSKAVVTSRADGKELKNDCHALASNAPNVDDSEKCLAIVDDANDFCEDCEDNGGQRVPDTITNDIVVPSNCDEDASHTGSCVTNQNSKLEFDDSHQVWQYDTSPVYDSEHTLEEEVKPEDESVNSLESLAETEEGTAEIPKSRPQKKLLLKSVLGGATAVGLIFIFLHLRKSGEEKDALPEEPSEAFNNKSKEMLQKLSPQKVKRRSTTEGVYPAEKLNLK